MALRMQITAFASPSPSRSRRAGFALESGSVARSGIISKAPLLGRCGSRLERKLRASVEVRLPAVGTVTEVDKDTFWPLVDAAGDRVVVLDMYTQWYVFFSRERARRRLRQREKRRELEFVRERERERQAIG